MPRPGAIDRWDRRRPRATRRHLLGRVARGLLVVLVVVLLVGVVAAGGLFGSVSAGGQTPQGGSFTVPGLADEATIQRDVNGITHISARPRTTCSAPRAGVHASERMWQMEVWRRIGAGRLSELFGESQVDTDRFIRTLDWRGAAQRDLETLVAGDGRDPRRLRRGRERLDRRRTRAASGRPSSSPACGRGGRRPRRLPPGAVDAPRHADLGQGPGVGPGRQHGHRDLPDARRRPARRSGAHGPALPGISGRPRRSIAAERRRQATASTAPRGAQPVDATLAPTAPDAAGAGPRFAPPRGNDPRARRPHAGPRPGARTAASARTTGSSRRRTPSTGGALLANDPHLGLNMPSVWYVNGLHCRPSSDACPYDVAGVSFPGTPGVVLGHNDRIAWGVTNVNPDVQDLVMEKRRPGGPSRYVTGGRVRCRSPLRTETIKVAGGAEVDPRRSARRSHGPILNDVDNRLKGADTLLALRWTALAAAGRRHRGVHRRRPGRELTGVPRGACARTAPRRRTSSTRTTTATSATRCRARSPSAPTPRTTALRPGARLGRQARVGRATSRSTTCPACSTRRRGGS